MHGDNLYLPSLHDPFESSTEGQHRASPGNFSFREEADDLSVVERLHRATERADDETDIAWRCDRDDLHGGHDRCEQGMCGIGGIHYESYGPIDAGHEQEAIDERHMVRDEQCPTGLRHMLLADDAKAI